MSDVAYSEDLTSDCTWYLAKARGEKSGPRLVGLCREMAIRQGTLITNTEKCIAVFQYGGDAKDISPGDHYPIEDNLVTFNAAQNAVETVFSKVIKPRITPMPLTTGGGYLQRHRAKQMGKAIEGVLADSDADALEEDVVMDALTTDHGAGAMKVIERHDSIKLEHLPIEDVWFDDAESRHRQPRCAYHVPRHGIDKYVALELYAKAGDEYPGLVGTVESRRAAILRAASKPEAWRSTASPAASHRVDIFEAWHLPSGDPQEYVDEETGETKVRHDGRHVVAVEGDDGTLIDEPWNEDHFPILLYVPRKRRRSIWGLSLMRDLIAPQREYEKLTKKIQHQHQKMGVSGWVASKESNVNTREITAGTFASGFVVDFDGPVPPQPMVTEPVAEGTYMYAQSIPRDMLERKGISTLAAASQLPSGLQQASGKALQVFEDFEDVRLLPYHRERERFKVALSWIIVCAAKRIVDRVGSYKARYHGKKGLEPIDWADVLMDRKDFVLKVFPISQLSKQPAAKFAQLTELLNAGAITVEQFKRLYELPDLEAENELDSADTDIIDRNMDIMVTTGRYLSPEPFDNLDLIIQRAGKFYNVCRAQDVPDDRLQLLRDLVEDAKSLKEQAAPPPAPPGAMPPPMDPGMMGPPGMEPPPGPLPGMDPGMPPGGPPPMPMAA
jgi:hypothetical protein